MTSEEWLLLPSTAKIAYMCIKCGFNGKNNGFITLYYSQFKRLLKSPATISKGIKILVDRGWILVEPGGLYRRASKYTLTFKHDKFK